MRTPRPFSSSNKESHKKVKKKTKMEEDERGKLFVGGLSWETTQENLQRFFSRYGEIVDCVVMKNNETGRSRGNIKKKNSFPLITHRQSCQCHIHARNFSGKMLSLTDMHVRFVYRFWFRYIRRSIQFEHRIAEWTALFGWPNDRPEAVQSTYASEAAQRWRLQNLPRRSTIEYYRNRFATFLQSVWQSDRGRHHVRSGEEEIPWFRISFI